MYLHVDGSGSGKANGEDNNVLTLGYSCNSKANCEDNNVLTWHWGGSCNSNANGEDKKLHLSCVKNRTG